MTKEQLMQAVDLDGVISRNLDWLERKKKLLNKVLNHKGIYMIVSIDDDDKIQIEKDLLASILADQIIGIESMIDEQKEKFKNL
jgi:hypothetical protein